MKRILVVGDFISGSGLTQVIFNVFEQFPDNYQIEVVAYGQDPTNFTDTQCKIKGWKLYRVIPVTKKPQVHWRWWREFFKSHHYDIVYFNYSSSWNFLPLVYARKYSNAEVIVCHSHNSFFSHVFSNKLMMKGLTLINNYGKHVFNENADVKIATSYESGKWMFGSNAQDIHIVPNGIDLNKFAYSAKHRKDIREKLGVDDEQLIGFVGVLQDRKNPLFALDVFEQYHKDNPKSKMLMLGKGPLKEKTQSEIKKRDLDSAVIQYDFIANINQWYSAMDALLFPSEYEGFGLVALEAQITNLPVLASNLDIDEIFATKNIYKMSDLKKNAWARKLKEVFDKSGDRNDNIDPSLQKFSVEKQAEAIRKLIERK